MKENLHQQFTKKLEQKYGHWEKGISKFGDTSFGKIATDLCISKSQFTMLISGTATEGMYIRSNRNVDQLIAYDLQKEEVEKLKNKASSFSIPKAFLFLLSLALLGLFLKNQIGHKKNDANKNVEPLSLHPFQNYFDGNYKANYVSPYLKETEVQQYCPCSAFEGVWELASEYIIPLPAKKPGLYYVAKSTDVRMKCNKSVEEEKRGKKMIGFENMHNELWLDTKRTSFSPKYFNQDSKSYTDEFYQLDIAENPDFIKIADIYSCFFSQFTIEDDLIIRKGEPCGRHAKNINEEVANKYEIDVKHILENIISSMAQIKCNPAVNNYCNPNTVQENISIIEYSCLFKIKTENLGIGGGYPYQKNYRLTKQNYSDNLLCNCKN